MTSHLKGKVALVTGANRGIGLAIAQGLSQLDVHVLVGARRMEVAVAAIGSIEGQATPVVIDVCDPASISTLAHDLKRDGHHVDILVNNAGIAIDQWQSGLTVSPELVRETINTNFIGALLCAQAFIPDMQARGWGRVVNISSELGSLSPPSQFGMSLGYRASKAALNAMTKFLALEVAKTPAVKINAACPGWVRTNLGGPDAPRTVEEGADTAVWLASLPDDGPSGGLFRDREPYPW
jgi:NAD(P)-dependent dehydrogenase (short-subunit alcohol dehydrogenase family)